MSLTFDTLNISNFRNRQLIKKVAALSIRNKFEVCKILKNNVPKSFIIKQLIIGRSTLYNILKKEKSLKEKSKAFVICYALHYI